MGELRIERTHVQVGGYDQDNAANGAYRSQVGGEIPGLTNGALSLDAVDGYVRRCRVALVLGDAPWTICDWERDKWTGCPSESACTMISVRDLGPSLMSGRA